MAKYKPYPYAYFQGQIVPIEEAQISIMTNALHYGIGVFGGIKGFKTDKGVEIFRLDDHLRRIQNSIEVLDFDYKFDVELTKKTVIELAKKNELNSTVYIRPLIYRSDTELSPDIVGDYDMAIYMLDMPNYFDPKKGLEVCISTWQRNSDNAIPPRTKATGGYINSALAIHDAHKSGFDSAIMLDKNGNVSEGAVMNIFLVKDGKLLTPSLDSDILEGITRRTVIELAKELKIPLEDRTVEKSEIFSADEIFFSGTAANITWCKSVDKTEITSEKGLITAKLLEAFNNLPKTHKELFTPIN